MRRHVWTLASILVLVVAVPRAAPLDTYEASVDSALRSQSPKAESLFHAANEARASGNHAQAVDLYGRVLAYVPGFFPASRRQAMERLETGDRENALAQLHDLIQRDSSAYTRAALATALVSVPRGQKPLPEQLDEAARHAVRVTELAPNEALSWATLWQVGFARSDGDLMQRAVEGLGRVAPNDWHTWVAVTINELIRGRPESASVALERARQLGMPEEEHRRFVEGLADFRGERRRAALIGLGAWSLGAWFAAFGVLLGLGLVLSNATLGAARRTPSNPSGKAVGAEGWLRRLYRVVLWLSCAFYYVSVPLVLALVLVSGGGLLYLLLRVGHIPIKLLLIVAFVTFISVAAIVRSLFVRGHDEDPGKPLDLEQHPRLRELLDRVASRIGTRAVDKVYLTPGTEIAVMERGGILRQMRGQSERCLILGIGVLEGMTIGQLKAILAHEYGHFSNRDTAGGGFALSVRRSLYAMAQRLAHGGVAGWFNPAWWFVRGFYAVFMRVSQGASRLQEVLADRWAALAYGSQAFAQGLTHVIAASVRFDARAQATLNEALKEKRPLVNLYRHRPAGEEAMQGEITDAIESAMTAEPSAFDSHPPPRQRLEWVEALGATGEDATSEDRLDAWELLSHRDDLEQEMTAYVRANVEAIHGVEFAPAGSES
jgi:Zn-dependent protease with chaperone function